MFLLKTYLQNLKAYKSREFRSGPYLIDINNCLKNFKYIKDQVIHFDKKHYSVVKLEFEDQGIVEIQIEFLPISNSNLIGAQFVIASNIKNLSPFERTEIQETLYVFRQSFTKLGILEITDDSKLETES